MNRHAIISRREALQILKNDLRRQRLEAHAAELNQATPEERAAIMARIEREIEKELRGRAGGWEWGALLH